MGKFTNNSIFFNNVDKLIGKDKLTKLLNKKPTFSNANLSAKNEIFLLTKLIHDLFVLLNALVIFKDSSCFVFCFNLRKELIYFCYKVFET